MTEQPKALIVDDSINMRKLLQLALIKVGSFKVDEAADGGEGLDKIKTTPYDVVITDVQMPVMDGFNLVRHIRESKLNRDCSIIVITVPIPDEQRQELVVLGANAVLTKPLQAHQLISTVAGLLNLT